MPRFSKMGLCEICVDWYNDNNNGRYFDFLKTQKILIWGIRYKRND